MVRFLLTTDVSNIPTAMAVGGEDAGTDLPVRGAVWKCDSASPVA